MLRDANKPQYFRGNTDVNDLKTRVERSLNGRIRRHFALKSFRAYARLDVPTFELPAIRTQLTAAGPPDSLSGQTAIGRVIKMSAEVTGRVMGLGPQSVVLWDALKSQPFGPVMVTSTLTWETVLLLWNLRLFTLSKAWAFTTTNKDYMKMKGWHSIVRQPRYRKEFVAGNMLEYASSEYKLASERVGDDDKSWLNVNNEEHTLTALAVFRESLVHLPQVAFTLHAVNRPRFLPVSLASLALLQNAAKNFAGSVYRIVSQGRNIRTQLNATRNMYEAESIPNIVPDGTESLPRNETHVHMGASIEFRNVSFSYPDAAKCALQDVSFTLNSGELCVIVGTNGAGKSTILKLLVRLYDPNEGQIFLDGLDIRALKLYDLRETMSFLFQDYTHFPLSIRDNIALGDTTCRDSDGLDERVHHAARLVGAKKFVDQLPQGFDTRLGQTYHSEYALGPPSGSKTASGRPFDVCAVQEAAGMRVGNTSELSGGQMQRLAVARMFMRSLVREDNKIGLLLFDEPSASLDPAGEHELFERLRELKGHKTMIFSSHRFGNLTRHADLIIYMDESGIIESGSHDELLRGGGEYERLWNLQAQAFK